MAQFFVLSLLYMAVLYRVDGGISIAPPVPAKGALSPRDAVVTCDSSGLQFNSISSLQISRRRATQTTFTLLASIFNIAVDNNQKLTPFFNSDTALSTRDGISLAGQGIQTDTTQVSSLELKIQQVNLLCTDEAEYECKVSYLNPSLSVENDKSYINMTIFVPPKDLTLTVTHNGVMPGEGLQSNPTEFNVGDVIQLSCSSSIGSNSNQEFKWRRTPITGFADFSPYNPDAANEHKGTVPATPVNCMYSRTATLSYNISQEDGNRNNVWGFKCEAEYGTQQTQSSSAYYITVEGGNQNQNPIAGTGAVSAAGSGGMIAGIVVGVVAVLVLVVLLVYFLWYRKRGGAGDTYRTKEEQGSSNPNLTDPDMYATVDKNKSKGHENKAMDEKHESRSKRNRDHNDYPRSYDNGRKNDYGNRNYALDRDEDDDYHSRDGSPTVHMSSGPIGTGV